MYWKVGVDGHTNIQHLFVEQDVELVDDKMPPKNTFARVEITPPEGDYLNTEFDKWVYQIDEEVKPSFLKPKHEKLCREAHKEWAKEIYSKINVEEARNPINPFKITPPKITQEHIALLKKWDSVRASVGDSVRDSVRDSVWDSVRDSVWASVWGSVWASVWGSVWGYYGSLFSIDKWENAYPYQSAVALWKQGLVPSYDGKTWRLHGGTDARILYEHKGM
ncbi:MAG: hypothetical protein WCX99_03030 [Candidatus Paceibacterota bacterium]